MYLWELFLQSLEQILTQETVKKWVRPLKIVRFDAANLYLQAQNAFQITWFNEHVSPLVQKKFVNNNNRPIKVHLTLEEPLQKGIKPDLPTPIAKQILPSTFDPELTLSRFIVEPALEVPYRLLSNVKKGSPFNPIFLYGPSGSGKTHLLNGTALELQKEGIRSFFVRAETFTEHVVQSIRFGKMQELRQVYRNIDALIVDDVHIFAQKHATQEEFFHTFNTLHTLGKTIILSANQIPAKIDGIESRLISRFEWGISLPLQPCNPRRLLEEKGALWNLHLEDAVFSFLLHEFSMPLLALQAIAFRVKDVSVVTLEKSKILLRDLLEKEKELKFTPEQLIQQIASHYGIRIEDILGKSQMREYVLPRQIAMYLIRMKLRWPFQKIGALFQRDHSTVMSSTKQIQKLLEEKNTEVTPFIKNNL